MDKNNTHDMVWWDEQKVSGTNVSIALTPSNHWGRRGAFDENLQLWGSYVVKGPENTYWFGGDTAYADCFEQIGRKYGPFNLATIPIGAYNPRWFMKHVHVNPEEAVQIHEDIKSLKSVGIHWGTFKLTFEPFMEPKHATFEAMEAKGLELDSFEVVNIGETVEGVHQKD